MDGSPTCECGKGTFGCSIHPNTPEAWVASMQDSLARILALPENRLGLDKKRAAACTEKSSASLAWFDPNTCSLKMSQQSLKTDSIRSSVTLPRSGMMRNGYVYGLPIVGRTIIGTGGGYWQTPTAHNAKEGAYPAEFLRNTITLAAQAGGKLNPTWIEWMMAFPLGFTASRDWGTHKSRSKRR
jgi:hypothetical protein